MRLPKKITTEKILSLSDTQIPEVEQFVVLSFDFQSITPSLLSGFHPCRVQGGFLSFDIQ